MLSAVDAGAASRTAVLVCQGRAVADGRMAPDHFGDPIAAQLLTTDERRAVDSARGDTPPASGRERLAWERLRACAEGMVPRTVLIDEAVRATSPRQLVIVGAGLDTRPWRLAELGHTRVFSVDHPASQADCRRRVGALEPVGDGLTYVAVDLASEPLGPALAASGHDPAVPTTWLWEGVVPYLARRDVEATLGAMSACASKGSTLVAQYQDRSAIARMGRRVSSLLARSVGLDDPLHDEPWRSLWSADEIVDLFDRHGFRVDRDEDLLTSAQRIGSPATHPRSLANGRIASATRV